MSYCRASATSSVYLIRHIIDDKLHCLCCKLTAGRDYVVDSPEDMLQHLLLHKNEGENVPEYAFERLRKEILK